MPTSFPTSLDALTNPASTDNLNTAGVIHNEQHANANDAIEALQAKVGIDGSGVTTSLDYYVKQRAALKDVANTFTPAQTFSAGILTNLGAVGTPSHSFTGDADTGLWSPAPNTLAFSTAGVERVRVDSAGLVGIGVVPSTVLTIKRDANDGLTGITTENANAGASSQARMDFGFNPTSGSRYGSLVYNSPTDVFFIQSAGGAVGGINLRTVGAHTLVFGTNATERARITSAGSIVLSAAALATTATDGFTYLPSVAGTPTGTPTTQTGTIPVVIDTTGVKLWAYIGGAWKSVTLA